MNTEQVTQDRSRTEGDVTGRGTNPVLNAVLFVLLFGLFAAGLYVLSLFTFWTFLIGLTMSIVALFLAFDVVPRFLT
ncbi:MAG TPA: hypothetical protein H9837_14160 [Candidatus Brachybacterium merdigallinarum]|jgi:hypothetical protein|nr:hypothetical protein [Candidatus Brachybacterium merdigallinarum]